MEASITSTGAVIAEGQTLGHIKGLLFVPNTDSPLESNAAKAAAELAAAPEIDRKLIQIAGSDHAALSLSDQGEIVWNEQPIGTLGVGATLLTPSVNMLGGDLGSALLRDQALGRMQDYMRTEISQKFESLLSLKTFADDPESFESARPLARILYDNHGAIERLDYMQIIKDTDPVARSYIRHKSGQFGFHQVFLRDLLKPAPARLMSLLFAFAWDKDGGGHKHPFMPPNGMASTPDDASYSEAALNKAGYTRKGARIIRFDILARLTQMILRAVEQSKTKKFRIAQEMLAILGCSFEDFQSVLKAIGYKKISVEMSPEEFEFEKSIIVKSLPSTVEKTEEQPEDKPETQSTATQQEHAPEQKEAGLKDEAPKFKRSTLDTVLTIFRPRPEMDADDNPIFPKSIDYWQRDYSKKFFKPARKNNSDSDEDNFTRGTSPHRKPRASKLSGYANVKPTKGKPGKSRPSKPQTWTAKPKKTSKQNNPEDSPFAALSGLKFSDSKKKDG